MHRDMMKTQVIYRILVVDRDDQALRSLNEYLRRQGYDVNTRTTTRRAMRFLENDVMDVVLVGMDKDPVEGIRLLSYVHQKYRDLPVIMLTAHGDVPTAVECLRNGAYDYLIKPLKPTVLKGAIVNALASRRRPRGGRRPIILARADYRFGRLVAKSPAMDRLCDLILRVSPADINLLIEGEPGTEKDLTAAVIHAESSRSDRPFIALHCGETSPEDVGVQLFRSTRTRKRRRKSAQKSGRKERPKKTEVNGLLRGRFDGTLYLGELDRLPFEMQEKLWNTFMNIKAPQRRRRLVPAQYPRVLASTTDVMSKVHDGPCFRDLFLHLGAITLDIPPLRNRPEDIPGLTACILSLEGERALGLVVEDGVYGALRQYAWPGNVAELCTVVTEAAAKVAKEKRDVLELKDLPRHFSKKAPKDILPPPAGALPDAERGKWLKHFLREQSQKLSATIKEIEETGNDDEIQGLQAVHF